jgi:hypothetical protein
MGIGASILLIAIGAILTFALSGDELFSVGGTSINMDTVGIILMIIGLVGLVLTYTVWGPRRRDTVVERDREIL